MDIGVIISQLIQLTIMIFLGYLLCKIGLLNQEMNQRLTKIILQVTMPCMVLNSVLENTGERDLSMVGLTFAVAVLYYVLMPFVGLLLAYVLRVPKNSRGLYTFMAVYENIGFMGFPLISAIYGSTAVIYTAIFNIIFNVTSFAYGPFLLSIGTGKKNAFSLKSLLSPGTLLSVFAIIIYITGLSFPEVIAGPIAYLGGVTTPFAMMLIGSTLALMNIREVFNDLHVYPFIVVRQILLPLITFPVFRFFIHDELLLGVTFILYIMPAASNCVLFATNYKGDEKLAAKTVFISTLLSIITIPALVMLCLL